MDLRTYCSPRGRTKQLACTLQVSASLVTQWCGGKPVAAERCYAIEQATGGAVRRWDLRPNDWWSIWPELVKAKGAPVPPDLVTPSPRQAAAIAEHPTAAREPIPGLVVRYGDDRECDRAGSPRALRETILRSMDRVQSKERA